MGHVEVAHLSHVLPDGRVLLEDVSFRAARQRRRAGRPERRRQDDVAAAGRRGPSAAVRHDHQQRRARRDAPVHRRDPGRFDGKGPAVVGRAARVRDAAARLDAAELGDDGAGRRAGPDALCRRTGRVGRCGRLRRRGARRTRARSRRSGSRTTGCQFRAVRTLSGGEQKRLVLEALLRGKDEVLLLDEPDNYLDVPGKVWLEQQLVATPKTVLLVSHDRELLAGARAADHHGRGRRRLDPRRRLRDLRAGPPGAHRAAR